MYVLINNKTKEFAKLRSITGIGFQWTPLLKEAYNPTDRKSLQHFIDRQPKRKRVMYSVHLKGKVLINANNP